MMVVKIVIVQTFLMVDLNIQALKYLVLKILSNGCVTGAGGGDAAANGFKFLECSSWIFISGQHCVEVLSGCYIEPVNDSYDYNWLIPQDECDNV